MSTVIKVENVSKQYRLGNVGTGTVSHDLNRWWQNVRGKEDPYIRIGEDNDRAKKGKKEYVWALKDINFEVKHGEVLGIIGRNGAGKSTLLKILSRTTAPTTGNVKIKGRVASLLEVGTGFHPELTGKENILLNGAILGMTKNEIKKKFDEIVDFSGVEQYIDTPVKRYSSGMYVRLAFAVAANLESEILIVDEVLAVGDAEFQRKCLGKMTDVSNKDGRTVLFVSHDLEAVLKLCSKSIYLKKGKIQCINTTSFVLASYLKSEKVSHDTVDLSIIRRTPGVINRNVKYISVRMVRSDTEPWKIKYRQQLIFEFKVQVLHFIKELELGVAIYSSTDFEIVSSLSTDNSKMENLEQGIYKVDFAFENFFLLPGLYKVGFGIRSEKAFEDYLPHVCEFEVLISSESASDKTNTRKGIIVPSIQTALQKL